MCMEATLPTATDEFSQKLLGYVNGGALSLMVSVGHRTGLFDRMAELAPSTSQEIAAAAGLNERYVREWLGAMVTGEIVKYDEQFRTYELPEAHAAVLTRAATPGCMASFTQWISVLGSVEDQIVECFYKGGGVPYSAYRRFHAVMAEESYQTTVAALDDHILPLVDGLVDKLEQGIEVLDVGCGSAWALIHMAQRFPNSKFTGYDISEEGIASGRQRIKMLGLKNIQLKIQDVSKIVDVRRFGLITAFDAIHDQARPDVVLERIAQAIAKDGIFLIQDIKSSSHVHKNMDSPIAPLVYTISCMHCMSVSLEQGGMGLGAAWGKEKATEMLSVAGFGNVAVNELPHDIQNYYYVAKM